MASVFDRVGTRDILAVVTVVAALTFNGLGFLTGAGAEPASMTLAGAVVGYYFKDGGSALKELAPRDEPLADPDLGDAND